MTIAAIASRTSPIAMKYAVGSPDNRNPAVSAVEDSTLAPTLDKRSHVRKRKQNQKQLDSRVGGTFEGEAWRGLGGQLHVAPVVGLTLPHPGAIIGPVSANPAICGMSECGLGSADKLREGR